MALKPMLIPKYSGIHMPSKKTLIIMINDKYKPLLENLYQPKKIILLEPEDNNISIQAEYFEVLINMTKSYIGAYNVIIYSDSINIIKQLIKLLDTNRLDKEIGLCTGADFEININNFHDLLGIEKNINYDNKTLQELISLLSDKYPPKRHALKIIKHLK